MRLGTRLSGGTKSERTESGRTESETLVVVESVNRPHKPDVAVPDQV